MIPFLDMFYTNKGFFPLTLYIPNIIHSWTYSLFFMSDDPIFVRLLFGIYALLLIFFILGYRTKTITFLLWIFIVSIHNRNWSGLNGGDDLIRTVFLIFCFLPLGAKYSIDSALNQRTDNQQSFKSLWGFTLFTQLSLMYICSALHKTHPIWTKDFTALSYVVYLDAFTKFPAEYLKKSEVFLEILSFLTYFMEKYLVYFIFLGFIPKLKHPTRIFVVTSFIIFHLSINFFMNVGNFAYYALSLWIAFLPESFWNKITYKKHSILNLYYDGHCGFCSKLSRILLTVLQSKELFLYQAQTNEEALQKMQKHNSWVVQEINGQFYFGFQAFVEVLKRSHFQFLVPILNLSIIKITGEIFYKFVANNRIFFSKITSGLKYRNENLVNNSLFTEFIGVPVLLLITYWCLNAANVPLFTNYIAPLKAGNRWLHTYQSWNLFAPYPKNTNVWFQFKGIFNDKSVYDVSQPGKVPFDLKINADMIRERFDNKSLRKTFMRMESDDSYRKYLAQYYCRLWNIYDIRHTRLDKVEIYMGKEHIYAPHKIKSYGVELVHSEFCQ